MVKFLLEAGADQEHKTDEMHTALMEASMDGHVEVARLLLDSGAQVRLYVCMLQKYVISISFLNSYLIAFKIHKSSVISSLDWYWSLG